MTEFPENLLSVFHGVVEEQDDRYVAEIPKSEISVGAVEPATPYRIAVFPAAESATRGSTGGEDQDREQPQPPVAEGEERVVEIEDIGEQGDGIARVERGYVVVVPETEKGERVTIRITDIKPTVAFAEVLSHEDYYD